MFTEQRVVLGFFAVILFGLIFLLSKWSEPRRGNPHMLCMNRLKQIGISCGQYRSRFHSDPPTLRALYETVLSHPTTFACRWDGLRTSVDPGVPWESFAAHVGYEFRPPPKIGQDPVEPGYVIAWDRKPHRDGSRCVLFFDGTVKVLDDRAFLKLQSEW